MVSLAPSPTMLRFPIPGLLCLSRRGKRYEVDQFHTICVLAAWDAVRFARVTSPSGHIPQPAHRTTTNFCQRVVYRGERRAHRMRQRGCISTAA